ncbi:MAG: MogA/MoaB family molybdenum cofactor biosynthesis protein [Actinomycetota bacterium]|nr:MogA/MoaB family molybdenum cofactor biosynthesis protein [Actinomycetota bacterium]
MKLGILTISDRAAAGERGDGSGTLIAEIMRDEGAEVVAYEIVSDEKKLITKNLIRMADDLKVDLIITTGGTGLSPRDVTPEATLSVIEREAPGLSEAIRAESLRITPNAMLSRGVSGVRGKTLIVNLPGSPKAVKEGLLVIIPALGHGIDILRGLGEEAASDERL